MDKATAVFDLMADARADKGSPTSALRAARACKALGLTQGEAWRVMSHLAYCDSDGMPYTSYAAKWDRVAKVLATLPPDAKAD